MCCKSKTRFGILTTRALKWHTLSFPVMSFSWAMAWYILKLDLSSTSKQISTMYQAIARLKREDDWVSLAHLKALFTRIWNLVSNSLYHDRLVHERSKHVVTILSSWVMNNLISKALVCLKKALGMGHFMSESLIALSDPPQFLSLLHCPLKQSPNLWPTF